MKPIVYASVGLLAALIIYRALNKNTTPQKVGTPLQTFGGYLGSLIAGQEQLSYGGYLDYTPVVIAGSMAPTGAEYADTYNTLLGWTDYLPW